MKLVERMARAICTAGGNDPGRLWGENAEEEWKLYVDEAWAAIAEIRIPTDAMARAGGGEGAVNAWHAMINAALAE